MVTGIGVRRQGFTDHIKLSTKTDDFKQVIHNYVNNLGGKPRVLLLDPLCQLGYLVVDGATLGDELGNFLVGVHHSRVISTAEQLPNFG